jgi:hypothetical protein
MTKGKTMNETINQAKEDFLRAKARLARTLETTPDERINWSPSPTARTPIQQVAHAAASVKSMHEMWDGRPFGIKTTEEADRFFRENERKFTTRDQVLEFLEKNSADYIAWLESLPPERLEQLVEAPFGLGQVSVAMGLSFMPQHVLWHVAQMEYIQTVYGDHDWHM